MGKTLDSYLWGLTDPDQLLVDFSRCMSPWTYDTSKIECPCFIYNGENECTPVAMAKQNASIVKGSELIIMPEHGHSTILMEAEKIICGLIKGEAVKSAHCLRGLRHAR